MDIKNFWKSKLMDFLMIQAGITFGIGIIGCINPPHNGVSHYILFMPFIYAFFCVMISCVTYSPKELSIKAMFVRKMIQFILIEVVVLIISDIASSSLESSMVVSIMIAVAVIYVAVNYIDYRIAKNATDEMTRKIKELKARNT